MNTINPNYSFFNQWISYNNHILKIEPNESLVCHQLLKKLKKGLMPAFDFESWQRQNIPELDYNQLVEDIDGMITPQMSK